MKTHTTQTTKARRKMIVDNFAGGGGTSIGLEFATGQPVDLAINHDESAIRMHSRNHRRTRHLKESVWNVNPSAECKGREVALAWFSPDCKFFSRAKGGKPVDREIRGLSWVVLRWLLAVRPTVFMLENVEEIVLWGPLVTRANGKQYPDPARKGETYQGFLQMLTTGIAYGHPAFLEACEFLKISTRSPDAARLVKGLGYTVEENRLLAADFGTPTTRRRLFVVGRCDGKPVVWPVPTHGHPASTEVMQGQRKPWRAAREVIDWTLPLPSAYLSAQEIKQQHGLVARRPLSPRTHLRIARALSRFVLEHEHPYIRPLEHGNGELTAPFLIQYHDAQSHNEVRGQTLDRPIMTIDCANRYALTVPILRRIPTATDRVPQPDRPFQVLTVTSRSLADDKEWARVREALNSTGHFSLRQDEVILLCIDGIPYYIADICLRLLAPRELYLANGFPPDYVIDCDDMGNRILRGEQVARCGNAVPPQLPEALVRVNLADMCGPRITTMAEFEARLAS